jgi:hypothetical protein
MALGKNRTEVRHLFQHRQDRLNTRVELVKPGEVKESFGPGRARSLKGKEYLCMGPGLGLELGAGRAGKGQN